MKREGDQFQSTLYDKIVRELMTLGEITGVTSHAAGWGGGLGDEERLSGP